MIEEVYFASNGLRLKNLLGMAVYPLTSLVSLLLATPSVLGGIFNLTGSLARHSKPVKRVLRGVLLAMLLMLVFGGLFIAADKAFASFVDDLPWPSLSIDGELVARVIFMGWVAVFLAGLFVHGVGRFSRNSFRVKAKSHPHETEFKIALSALNALFLIFLVVQFTHLFAGNDLVLERTGLSYAEYARQGFFQLIVVVVGVVLTVFGIERALSPNESRAISRTMELLSLGLIVQTVVVAISAVKRLNLYQSVFGQTFLRLYSELFVYLLVGLLLALTVKVVRGYTRSRFLQLTSGGLATYLVLLNMINPELYIARSNIRHSQNNDTEQFDIRQLASFSADAIDAKVEVLNNKELFDQSFQSEAYTEDEYGRGPLQKGICPHPVNGDSATDSFIEFNFSRWHEVDVFDELEICRINGLD